MSLMAAILKDTSDSAKGGVIVSLAQKFGLPVHAIGVGEQLDDLQPFKAEEFSESLLDINS